MSQLSTNRLSGGRSLRPPWPVSWSSPGVPAQRRRRRRQHGCARRRRRLLDHGRRRRTTPTTTTRRWQRVHRGDGRRDRDDPYPSDAYNTQVTTQLQAGNAADMMVLAPGTGQAISVVTLAEAGFLEPLDETSAASSPKAPRTSTRSTARSTASPPRSRPSA